MIAETLEPMSTADDCSQRGSTLDRRRLAEELHDGLGQDLTALALSLKVCVRLARGALRLRLQDAEGAAERLIVQVQKLAADSAPAAAGDIGLVASLVSALDQLGAQAGLRVEFRHEGVESVRFAAPTEAAVLSVARNALVNVARHSGVNQATLTLTRESTGLILQIDDRGRGFDSAVAALKPNSVGLRSMRARVKELGGTFVLATAPGVGTQIRIELPFHPDSPVTPAQ